MLKDESRKKPASSLGRQAKYDAYMTVVTVAIERLSELLQDTNPELVKGMKSDIAVGEPELGLEYAAQLLLERGCELPVEIIPLLDGDDHGCEIFYGDVRNQIIEQFTTRGILQSKN